METHVYCCAFGSESPTSCPEWVMYRTHRGKPFLRHPLKMLSGDAAQAIAMQRGSVWQSAVHA